MELNASVSAIITGIIIPFVLPLIMQSHWSSRAKSLVTFGIAIAAGVINAVITGQTADVATVLAGVVIVYQSFNKTGVFDAIGTVTDFTPKLDEVPEPKDDYQANTEEK